MTHRTALRGLAGFLLALFALLAAGCGGGDSSDSGGSADAGKIKAAMVTDIGGLNDRSFNSSAYAGLKKAEQELGVEIRALTSKSNADYVPNLTSLAREGYDVIFAVGFLMAESTEAVAKEFPDTTFAIIDSSQQSMKTKPANVEGLLFAEQEAGYLVGAMAAQYVKQKGGKQVISAIGGQKIPPVESYIAGYQTGAKATNPDVEVLTGFSQDFIEQARCKEIGLDQIQAGSQVVFQVAGQCGLGALDAAKQEGVQGIGVDADQGYLGDFMMTSALKRIDQAVAETVKTVSEGGELGGRDRLFDLKVDGVAIGKTNKVGSKLAATADEVKKKIIDGEIKDIPREVAAGR